jgi:hypothetical protein
VIVKAKAAPGVAACNGCTCALILTVGFNKEISALTTRSSGGASKSALASWGGAFANQSPIKVVAVDVGGIRTATAWSHPNMVQRRLSTYTNMVIAAPTGIRTKIA